MNKESYAKVPNEILEILAKTKLNSSESRYIFALLRKTYGWNKKSDYISNSQFVRATGITKQHIWRTEKRLLWREIVAKRGNKTGLNISYEQWKELPKWATVTKSGVAVAKAGKKVAYNGGDKEYLPKEIKQIKNDFSFKKEENELIENLISWADNQPSPVNADVRRLMENTVRKYGYEKVSKALKIHGQDINNGFFNFWKHLTEECRCFFRNPRAETPAG